jgi:hypothetical protein
MNTVRCRRRLCPRAKYVLGYISQEQYRRLEESRHLSDRAIAADIGVDHKTVGTARKKLTGEHSPVEKRVGRDGKARIVQFRPRRS